MGENPPEPAQPTDPTWVGRARARNEPTPAYDAYLKMSAPSLLAAPYRPAGRNPVTEAVLLDEVDRLNTLIAALEPVLERAMTAEACRWESRLRYPLVKLAADTFIAWVGSCDAPAGWVMTRAQAAQVGWTPARIDQAREPDEVGYLFNRAGPGEKPLTVDALLGAYTDADANAAFRLTPALIQCGTTCGREDPDTGDWDQTAVYWSPWEPGAVPARLPDGWADRF